MPIEIWGKQLNRLPKVCPGKHVPWSEFLEKFEYGKGLSK